MYLKSKNIHSYLLGENRLYEEEIHMKKLLSDKDGDTHTISKK